MPEIAEEDLELIDDAELAGTDELLDLVDRLEATVRYLKHVISERD